MPKRRLSDVEEIHAQLRIQSALLAALTWQRTGVRPSGFDHLALPDPFARLVPYARAMVALQEYTARAAITAARRSPTTPVCLNCGVAIASGDSCSAACSASMDAVSGRSPTTRGET